MRIETFCEILDHPMSVDFQPIASLRWPADDLRLAVQRLDRLSSLLARACASARDLFRDSRSVADQLPAGVVFALSWMTTAAPSGLHTRGVAWRHDSLSPRFQTNFVHAQRFLQLSADLPGNPGTHRLAPVSFVHAPTSQKPKRNAPAKLRRHTVARLLTPASACAPRNRSASLVSLSIRMRAAKSALSSLPSIAAYTTPPC